MTKYDPLRRYLVRQKAVRVELSFSEIERLIGGFLPKAATRAPWWSEMDRDGRVPIQVQACGQAGYRAELAPGDRVVFERI